MNFMRSGDEEEDEDPANRITQVSDGAILLEKHNLYESGHLCICKYVRPPLLCAFVYSLSARERERGADELFV